MGHNAEPVCSVICRVKCSTYPDVVVILNELRVSEQAPLQHGLQQGQVDHVEQQQAQDGQVHDDGELEERHKFTHQRKHLGYLYFTE